MHPTPEFTGGNQSGTIPSSDFQHEPGKCFTTDYLINTNKRNFCFPGNNPVSILPIKLMATMKLYALSFLFELPDQFHIDGTAFPELLIRHPNHLYYLHKRINKIAVKFPGNPPALSNGFFGEGNFQVIHNNIQSVPKYHMHKKNNHIANS